MVQSGFNRPANDVVQGNYLTERLNVETATNVYPGALVIRGASDYDVAVCSTDGSAIGWAGYQAASAPDKPATRDTMYEAGAEVPVHNGGNFRVRAMVASEAITKGDPLAADTNGTVTAVAAGTVCVAHAAETVTTSATRVWVVSNI